MTREQKQRLIEDVVMKMCDDYCKYPEETFDQDELDKMCDACPLNDLWDLQREV